MHARVMMSPAAVLRTGLLLSLPAAAAGCGATGPVPGGGAVLGPVLLGGLAVLVAAMAWRARAARRAALRRLAEGLAEELAKPATVLKVLAQLTAERGTAAGLPARHPEILSDEVGRLEALLHDLRDFAGRPRPAKRPVEAGALLRQAADAVAAAAARRGVALSADLPAGPVWLDADAGQLGGLLLRLLRQAVDATPKGGRVWLEAAGPAGAAAAAGRGGWLTVRVADSGWDLPAARRGRIFEPLGRARTSGLSLGLAACRHIARAHGGTIAAADRPGGGAVFTVRLPVPRDPSGEGAEVTHGPPAGRR